LTTEGVNTIREGLLEHLVLCFRGQKLLSVEEHMRLARCFGEPEPTPFRPVGTATPRDVLMLDQYDPTGSEAAHFHADNTFRPEPPIGAILQAHVVPERGGDTADEVAAAHEERCV